MKIKKNDYPFKKFWRKNQRNACKQELLKIKTGFCIEHIQRYTNDLLTSARISLAMMIQALGTQMDHCVPKAQIITAKDIVKWMP